MSTTKGGVDSFTATYINKLEAENENMVNKIKQLVAQNVKLHNAEDGMRALRAEIDRYDKICTEIRNLLSEVGIPELTDDRLSVLSLGKRVARLITEEPKQLRLKLETAEAENEQLKNSITAKNLGSYILAYQESQAENAKLTASNLDFIRANNEVGNLNANLQAENAKLRAKNEILRDLLMEHAPGLDLAEALKEVK